MIVIMHILNSLKIVQSHMFTLTITLGYKNKCSQNFGAATKSREVLYEIEYLATIMHIAPSVILHFTTFITIYS